MKNPSRTSRHIRLDGRFESSVLGTFSIIRGFANLKDLAAISVPYTMEDAGQTGEVSGQQRTIDQAHAERIKRYLERGEQRFIPEIILSMRTTLLPLEDRMRRVVGVVSPVQEKGISVRRAGKFDQRIMIDRKALPDILANKLIRRVDGNHRLALASSLKEDPRLPTKYLAPFCILLLGEPGDTADDYSESLIFHTINSTALPLESEHALKLILGQKPDFDMNPDREFAFNPELHFTRLLRDGLLKLSEPAQTRLGDRPLTSLRRAARAILEMDPALARDLPTLKKSSKALLAAITDVATLLEPGQPSLCRADFFIELAARVWRATADGEHNQRVGKTVAFLEELSHWLSTDGLVELQEGQSLSKQVLDIYSAVRTRIPKRVFLARWYPTAKDGEDNETAKLRLKQIKQALSEIENEERAHLELVDMGTQTGSTFPIHPRMYEAIASADIILVDLTGVRPNVCVEAGYALRNHEKNRLIFIFQPTEAHKAPPFDLNTFRYEPLKETAEIPDKVKPHIRSILRGAAVGS